MSWLKKLKSGLGKTTARVSASLGAVLGRKGIDAASVEELEDALISADLGTAAAAKLAERMRKHKFDGEINSATLAAALSDGIAEILEPVAQPLSIDQANQPHVVLLVGVNGSGKTTTAGKLAQHGTHSLGDHRWRAHRVHVAGTGFRRRALLFGRFHHCSRCCSRCCRFAICCR